MPDQSLPRVVLINANGHRDMLDAGTIIEFVFDKERAVQVSFPPTTDKTDIRLKVQEVRSGVLSVEPESTNTVRIVSPKKNVR